MVLVDVQRLAQCGRFDEMLENREQTTVFRGFGADGTGKSRRPRKPVEQPVEPQFNNLILT